MARSTPTDADIERMLLAVVEQAQAQDKLPVLLTETIRLLYENDPKKGEAALRRLILASIEGQEPEQQQQFLEGLLSYASGP